NLTVLTGRVGINTATPSSRLHVNGVITATGGNSTNWNTAYDRVPAGINNRIPKWSGDTSYVASSISEDDAGNVGIGGDLIISPGATPGSGNLEIQSGRLAVSGTVEGFNYSGAGIYGQSDQGNGG